MVATVITDLNEIQGSYQLFYLSNGLCLYQERADFCQDEYKIHSPSSV